MLFLVDFNIVYMHEFNYILSLKSKIIIMNHNSANDLVDLLRSVGFHLYFDQKWNLTF